jgi:hypothetical protein
MSERPTIWLCVSCGKRSRTRSNKHPIDIGYSEQCEQTSVCVYEDSVVLNGSGKIVKAKVVEHE